MTSSLLSLLAAFSYGPQTIALALTTPLALLALCAVPALRALRPIFLALAPIPALAAAVLAADSGPLIIDQMLFPAVFVLDPPGALLLATSALMWIAAGLYALAAMQDEARQDWFAASWLLTLLGNIGVFLAADVASFYLAFALVSLPAYGLIVTQRDGGEEAGRLYVSVALLGEAFLIAAFVALALGAPDHSLLISDGVGAVAASPWRDATIGLLIAGFATKIGVLPFHVWMPSTYRTAPLPAAAALSGAAVNAGVIGLIRFLPFNAAVPEWGDALAALGMTGAFYGVILGLTQRDIRAMLACSSVSQMGLVAATIGKGLATGDALAAPAAALYASHHGLAKGGLFLAIGVFLAEGIGARRWTLPIIALLALSLAGLPPTGGAIAKLAIKEPLGDGLFGILSTLSAIASTMLMLQFVARLRVTPPRATKIALPGVIAPWLFITFASVLIPSLYFMVASGDAPALDPSFYWKGLWPVAIGALLARVFGSALDRALAAERDRGALFHYVRPGMEAVGRYAETIDRLLQRWSIAATALLLIAGALSTLGYVGR